MPFQEPSVEFWACELKVDKWKRALYQALRYRAFAHCSVVIIPDCVAHRVRPNAERFRSLRIGVVVIDLENHRLRTMVKPWYGEPLSKTYYYHALMKFLTELKSA